MHLQSLRPCNNKHVLKQDALPPGLLYRAALTRPIAAPARTLLLVLHVTLRHTPVCLRTTPTVVDKPARGPRPRRAVIVNVPRPCEIRKDGGRSISLGDSGDKGRTTSDERWEEQSREKSKLGSA